MGKLRLHPAAVIALLLAAIAGLLYYIIPLRYHLNHREFYDALVENVKNPLIGYAPAADNPEACKDTTLVFIGLTWAEWEPERGRFDIEGMEEKYHIQRWKEEGKRAVLRFIADYPGEERHLDIPDWLYRATRDGHFYETSYGSGYAPDYSNAYLKERHLQAIEALADYCNQDEFVAYVELGTLGHWGEWHTHSGEDSRIPLLPDAELCWEYALDYSDHFFNALLLMRRNYPMMTDAGLGLYHDMVGSPKDTKEWMKWLQEGGVQDTQGAPLELEATANYWENAPVGGEMTSGIGMETILGDGLRDTIDMIRGAHMSFLGPKCPVFPEGDGGLAGNEELMGAAELIEGNLGYRLYISSLQTRFDFGQNRIHVTFQWENNGVAPCYWDWPVMMVVYDHSGKRIYWQSLELAISTILPGSTVQTEGEIPYSNELNKGYSIGIVITSPDEREHIRLAMKDIVPDEEGVHILYTHEGTA